MSKKNDPAPVQPEVASAPLTAPKRPVHNLRRTEGTLNVSRLGAISRETAKREPKVKKLRNGAIRKDY